jgi:ubiquinone/menaquinone biosynthesis C-methylase UbiE
MQQKNEFPPITYWKMTPIILHQTLVGMDNRAEIEYKCIQDGGDLAQVHGETVKNYSVLDQLVNGAIRLLNKVGYPMKGFAADLGLGTGVGACILSKVPEIQEIYAIEYSVKHVTHVMPEVFHYFHAKGEKIRRVVGDFNDIQLPDESVDVILEIDSYHHSEDLSLSAREAYRVLKPGGAVIAVDRAWADETPEAHLDDLLAKEFPVELKKKYGIKETQSFTRRDFGEHEYTRCFWEHTFQKVGFKTFMLIQDHPKNIPGANFILLRLPAFDWSINLAAKLYLWGRKRATVYGWGYQRHVMLFIKPKAKIER